MKTPVRSSHGRLEYTGRIPRDAFAVWAESPEGLIAIDRVAAGRPGLESPQPYDALALGAVLMIFAAWALTGRARPASERVAAMGIGVTAALIAGHAAFAPLAPAYDGARPAMVLSALERQGIALAVTGDYESEFHFEGRLTKPIVELLSADPVAWAQANPRGVIIATYTNRAGFPLDWPTPIYVGAWRGRVLAMWAASRVVERGPELLSDLPRGTR